MEDMNVPQPIEENAGAVEETVAEVAPETVEEAPVEESVTTEVTEEEAA